MSRTARSGEPSRRRRVAGNGLALVLSLALIEILGWTLGQLVVIPRANFVFYRPPQPGAITAADFARYLATRDPDVGWPSPSKFGSAPFDASGARSNPSYPEPGTEYVSSYGDSFTFGDEVSDDAAWSHVLSRRLGARVANFGVGGYGTDQAFLRFKKNTHDHAHLTILGIYPDDLKRNVNQQRYFLSPAPATYLGLKPRFVLDGDVLKLEPLPTMTHASYLDSFEHPARYFAFEHFLPGTPEGPLMWSFPFSLSIARAALSPQVVNWMRGKPGWSDFASDGHASHALAITAAIARAFQALAAERGKRVVVVLFPSESSFESYRRGDELPTAALAALLATTGSDVLDLTAGFDDYLGRRQYGDLLHPPPDSHYTPEGNRVVADLVYEFMRDRSLLPGTVVDAAPPSRQGARAGRLAQLPDALATCSRDR